MLILIAHGSHDPKWRAPFERLAETLRRDLGPHSVRLAYMDCTPPTLRDAADDAARSGVREVRVLPLFLASGGHVDHDIPPLVEEARRDHPEIAFKLLPPIGDHPQFVELIRRLVTDAANPGPSSSASW